MRNLSQYPITRSEAISAVRRAGIEYQRYLDSLPLERRPLGDIHGPALIYALRLLESESHELPDQ